MKFKLVEKLNNLEISEGFKEVQIADDGTLLDLDGAPVVLKPNPAFGSDMGNFSDLNDDDIIDLDKYDPVKELHKGWADRPYNGNDNSDDIDAPDDGAEEGEDTNPDDATSNGNKGGNKKSKKRSRGKGKGSGKGENIFKLIIETTRDILEELQEQDLAGIGDNDDTKNGEAVIKSAQQIMYFVHVAEKGSVDDDTLDDVWDLKNQLKNLMKIFYDHLEPKVTGNVLNNQNYQDLVNNLDFFEGLYEELDEAAINIQEHIFDYFPNKCYIYVDNNTGEEYIKFGDDVFYNVEDYYEMRD